MLFIGNSVLTKFWCVTQGVFLFKSWLKIQIMSEFHVTYNNNNNKSSYIALKPSTSQGHAQSALLLANRCVLSPDLKIFKVCDVFTDIGKSFHKDEAAERKDLDPKVFSLYFGTLSRC